MNQKLFSNIQSRFKDFLNERLHPDANDIVFSNYQEVNPTPPSFRVELIEETAVFGMGNDDDAVGYRITYKDRNGKTRTKLSATPTL